MGGVYRGRQRGEFIGGHFKQYKIYNMSNHTEGATVQLNLYKLQNVCLTLKFVAVIRLKAFICWIFMFIKKLIF